MLVQRRRRWVNIILTLAHRLLPIGRDLHLSFRLTLSQSTCLNRTHDSCLMMPGCTYCDGHVTHIGDSIIGKLSANTGHWSNAGSMLAQRRRRWANIE